MFALRLFSIITVVLLFFPLSTRSAMTGGDFEIFADSFSILEDQFSSGGDFGLFGTGGEFFAENATGNTFELRGGFQAMERGSLSLQVSTTSVALGQLSTAAVTTGSLVVTVSTDSTTGYTVTVVEDGNLRKGNGGDVDNIDDVADGAVTAGVEEYGIRTVGGGGQLAADTAMTGVALAVASSNMSVSHATTVQFRASIQTSKTRQGSYTHTVTFSGTVNP
ncbi:MAG: hypothetical protein A3J66_01585 [Candidatus Magasanikbacteria bacterium RIFCSPHIGHO2_02_FULL_47_14]|uniref:Uncharacterized protein n=1 Tax=Candidatus Magasanikbacteria bacterium RIFCSPHIGHO2_02_FULL_47_14 TaxID=1798680 RepID=A0A1F6LYS1_9BACT|nr:MAG: hypothetical protein A3J66_01585 [Candidatus Magasanikbacteria bacterium RIFCSPHIGHO2_02_FULL_47_14]